MTTEAVLAAVTEWGNYGPIEYWVVGGEIEANQDDLVALYCDRHYERGHIRMQDCLDLQTSPERYGIEYYREVSAEVIRSGEPRHDAALSGDRNNGVQILYSSVPPGFMDDPMKVPGAEDQKTIFHEMFHTFQHAHIDSKNRDTRDALLGPTWWAEGGAEFMAHVGLFKSRMTETISKVNSQDRWPFEFKDKLQTKIQEGKQSRKENCPDTRLVDINFKNPCNSGYANPVYYDLGSWAVAYLYDRAGPGATTETFFPSLNELGWEGAFVNAFGISSAEFYDEFDLFLELPLKEQLAILPDLE